MRVTLTMTAYQHGELKRCLFPGDGKEAVAFVLCGRHAGATSEKLLAREVVPVPPESYMSRSHGRVSWKTDVLTPLIQKAMKEGAGLLKVHSHPSGFRAFSNLDDQADRELFPRIHDLVDDRRPHASAIMLPDGSVLGRAHRADGSEVPLERVTVVGDEISVWNSGSVSEVDEAGFRNAQVFGEGTYRLLRSLRIAVVGCSGTGSVVVENLARLMPRSLVLVDPDVVERKNLNRILNAGQGDVGKAKVDVLKRSVDRMALGTDVTAIPVALDEPSAIRAVGGADIVFGCVDSIDGRHLLNRLATFYTLPYIDVGVRLEADGNGGISQICGSIHYVKPGGSSLVGRGLYTYEALRAANLRKFAPEVYEAERAEKYISGVEEERPAVCPVNSLFAARAVLEMLARLHPYRHDDNRSFAVVTESLTGMFTRSLEEQGADVSLKPWVGAGDVQPLLGLPFLGAASTCPE